MQFKVYRELCKTQISLADLCCSYKVDNEEMTRIQKCILYTNCVHGLKLGAGEGQ